PQKTHLPPPTAFAAGASFQPTLPQPATLSPYSPAPFTEAPAHAGLRDGVNEGQLSREDLEGRSRACSSAHHTTGTRWCEAVRVSSGCRARTRSAVLASTAPPGRGESSTTSRRALFAG